MKEILLLTDFSELSEYARALADKVAYHTGAKLHVLKVVDIPSEIEISKAGNLLEEMGDDIKVYEKEKQVSEKKMKEWTASLKSNVETEVMYGRILKTVAQQIETWNIDLVIMGTHGVSGLRELLSGSITEHLILKTSVPVLSIKCNRDSIDFSDFLITGDFESKESSDLEILKGLQQVFNSTMHLLWVNTKHDFITQTEAMEKMRKFAQINKLNQIQYHIYNDKSVEDGIINFSNDYDQSHDLDIDIVAVEKKNKSQLGYMLTGCQATSFVNHIFRPLITYSKK